MLPLLLLLGIGIAVIVSSGGDGGPATDVRPPPPPPAAWLRDDGSYGMDIANHSRYGPAHIYSPRGYPIVRRNEQFLLGQYWRFEIDAPEGQPEGPDSQKWFTIADPSITGTQGAINTGYLLPYGDTDGVVKSAVKQLGATAIAALPVAQFVISFVPGIGAGINAAIAGGIALAKGQTLSEAAVAAARASMPGAPLSTAAFDAGLALARGESLSAAALKAARAAAKDAGGDLAARAFDVAVAVGTGQSIQRAAFDAVVGYIPNENLKEFAKRVADGQNVVDAARAVGGEYAAKVARKELDRYVPPILTDDVIIPLAR